MRKVWNIASIALIVVLSASVLLTMVLVGTLSLTLNRENSLFGCSVLAVEMDSAGANAGDLVFAGVTELQPGDLVAFRSNAPQSYGQVTVSSVESISEGAVKMTDGREVQDAMILGTVVSLLPGGAAFLQKCKSPLSFCLWAVVPLLVVFTLVTLRTVDKHRRAK